MTNYSTTDIRNIALVGHGNVGKTTLVEALLHHAGSIKQPGDVLRGNTISDFEPQEHTHQFSINSSIITIDHLGSHINLLDTPGYPDFIGRAYAVLPAVETVAVVINAQTGIEVVTGKTMGVAQDRRLSRLIVINKIDTDSVDLPGLVSKIQETFGTRCLPINLPAKDGAEVIDCFFQANNGITDFFSVKQAHANIVDQVVELDEGLMELYLEQGEELSPEQLHEPLEKALREGHLIPICFVSARTGAGIEQLLQIFVKLMPNPVEGNLPQFLKGDGEAAVPAEFTPDANKHVLAHVFKIMIDPFIGRLGIFRIHQGTIVKDSQLYIGDERKPFKVNHLLSMHGKDHSEISKGIPGDICAVSKVDEITFDSILHDSHEEDNIHLHSVEFPPPMFGLAIEAKKRGDEQKVSDALHKLDAEDPSLIVEHNAAQNETVIRGQGELHLRIILEKLKDQFHVELDTKLPQIAYKETITVKAEGHHKHKKQTGGAGQFGEVYLRIEPLSRGGGFEFVDKVVGGVIPKQYIPAIEKGIQQVLAEGVIAGFPMQDIRVTVYDGKYHSVDSKEIAFISAGKKAFNKAVEKATPVVLEPIVEISITTPGESVGDITADFSGKRGRISNTSVTSDSMIILIGQVPLSELDNYQSKLKSLTGGRGYFSISFSHYDPVPAKTQQNLQSAYRPLEES